MSVSRIAVRYATPILELAEEKKVLDNVKDDMESFVAVCEESRDFALMLKSPIIAHQKKAEILKKVFSGKVNELTLQAFDIITRKSRENLLEDIAAEFLHLYNVKKGLAEVSVTTSFELDDEMKKAFEKLSKEITGKEPLLSEKVDPEIVGGYILRMGDQQLDESVSGQLKDLKLKFSKK
ncbi:MULTISPECIES: ATP synthase F1 subunit delta [unclassified Ekhidna]|jgi:F-type H+-transporting ATPase subunit delta|uniref:ATP synthase F1 subunit delta n=1 Tax=unclassified Ekhidna TaxID=2632188 RepID=UPI0032DFBED5